MSEAVEVRVPDIGDFNDVPVIEVLVKPGDTIKPNDSLITLESEKASMEVPSPSGGVVKDLKVNVGDKISKGSVILTLEAASAPAPAEQKAQPVSTPQQEQAQPPGAVSTPQKASQPAQPTQPSAQQPKPTQAPQQAQATQPPAEQTKAAPAASRASETRATSGHPEAQPRDREVRAAPERKAAQAPPQQKPEISSARKPQQQAPPSGNGATHASPSIRRFARELGVDLRRVQPSGPNKRVTRDDVQNFVKRALRTDGSGTAAGAGVAGLAIAPWPKVDFAKYGEIERKPLSRIKKISGPNLLRNWVMIPHVTQNDDADVTDLEAFRRELNAELEKRGVKVTMLAFLIKAAIAALKRFPDFNSSLDGDQLVYKKYYNVGFAADTPGGLVVPVVKNADRKGIADLAQETADLAAKARDGKLTLEEMQGGTFTISSLGGIGGTYFTPIINAPEVAILGACRAAMRPVWDGSQFVPKLMQPLSLSYDHRVIDGASAARFTAYLATVLADLRRALV